MIAIPYPPGYGVLTGHSRANAKLGAGEPIVVVN